MADYIIKGKTLTNIADKIREYTDPEQGYTPEEMPNGIDDAVLSTVLNVCKAEESGTAVGLRHVLDLPHSVKVGLKSKNLASTNAYATVFPVSLEAGKTYIVSVGNPSSDEQWLLMYDHEPAEGDDPIHSVWIGWAKDAYDGRAHSEAFTPPKNITHAMFAWGTVANIIDGMIEEGSKPTKYTPYVADDAPVTLYTGGKNLLPFPYPNLTEATEVAGVTCTPQADGSILVNGTATEEIYLSLNVIPNFLGCTDTITPWENPTGYISSDSIYWDHNNGTIFLRLWKGDTYNNRVFYPQIEVGNVATSREKYKAVETITTTIAEGAEFTAIAPNMSIYTHDRSVVIDAEYARDWQRYTDELIETIISLGGSI